MCRHLQFMALQNSLPVSRLVGYTCSHLGTRLAPVARAPGFQAFSPPLSHCPGHSPSLWPCQQVSALLGKPEEVDVAGSLGGLHPAWFDAFRQHQAFEVGRACAHVLWYLDNAGPPLSHLPPSSLAAGATPSTQRSFSWQAPRPAMPSLQGDSLLPYS